MERLHAILKCITTNLCASYGGTRTWTLDIHEIGIRALYETLLLMPPSLLLRGGVQQVFCELWIFNDFN